MVGPTTTWAPATGPSGPETTPEIVAPGYSVTTFNGVSEPAVALTIAELR